MKSSYRWIKLCHMPAGNAAARQPADVSFMCSLRSHVKKAGSVDIAHEVLRERQPDGTLVLDIERGTLKQMWQPMLERQHRTYTLSSGTRKDGHWQTGAMTPLFLEQARAIHARGTAETKEEVAETEPGGRKGRRRRGKGRGGRKPRAVRRNEAW